MSELFVQSSKRFLGCFPVDKKIKNRLGNPFNMAKPGKQHINQIFTKNAAQLTKTGKRRNGKLYGLY